MSTPNLNRKPAKSFSIAQVADALTAKGIHHKIEGQQVNADMSGSGHMHIKITPSKGLYLDAATGKGGTVSALLRKIGSYVPSDASNGDQQAAQAATYPACGGHGRDTTDAARRIWNAGWTCTHASDLPGGWDKKLAAGKKGAVRERLERHRDIMRGYLAARLGPGVLDHWSRQVRISADGLMLTPMLRSGQVVGIQRTYFDDAGQKTERKMLGQHGVHALTPPPGVAPRDLGVGSKCILVGEGWETTAAAVQSAGWPGVCAYDAGGIVKWAEQQAEQAKKLTADQVASAPAAVFLVDRDVSGTGQKASARAIITLRDAGLKAFYAIPPAPEHGGPRGGPKGSDWGDYPKESISGDVLAAHLALAIAHSDREMRAVDGVDMDNDAATSWRPSIAPQSTAESAPTEEVRDGLNTEIQKTVFDYVAWLKNTARPFPPVLMQPTTGTGKSTAAKALSKSIDIRMSGGRVCVFVPDHAQAAEYEDAGFFHFYGRNPDPTHCAFCPAHATVQEAMKKGHISQAEVCRQCNHGYRWTIDYYSEKEGPCEKVETAKKKLSARGLDWKKVIPCRWQTHLRDALAAPFVVAASGSYSHSLTRDSLVIFDEHFEPGKGVNITLQDVDHWSKRNAGIITYLENGGGTEALERHRQADDFFRAVAQAMAGWVGKTGAISVDHALLSAIAGILEAAKKSRKDDVDLAVWESLKFDAAGELADNPLRAAHAIAESLKFGDGYVHDGQLVVAASLPVMERLAMGEPTVILDATPDPVIVDVVQAQGGRIVSAIAHQNVRITRFPTRFWGLTPLNSQRAGPDRVVREAERYTALIDHYHQKNEWGKTAFLFHKKAWDTLNLGDYATNADGDPVAYKAFPYIKLGSFDYWGRGHRAHNRWTNKALVIVGSFFPPLEAQRSMYQVSRIAALSAGADAGNWPVWPDDMEMIKDAWVCEGTHDVPCRLPLPADPRIRTWLLTRITSETVQAIGRARGANAEAEIAVHVYGGVPLHGLWQHGLAVAEYADDPECLGQTKAQHMDAMRGEREDNLARVDTIAARVIAGGRTVTRQSIEDEVNAMLTEAAAMTEDEDGQDGHLFRGGIYILSTPEQIENPIRGVPRPEAIQEWIATRMPVLSTHLSTKGRNGGLVKAAQSAARTFGEEMLKEAMEIAEDLIKASVSVDDVVEKAWDTVETDTKATSAQVVAARLTLEATGRTEGVPLPWDEVEEVAEVM